MPRTSHTAHSPATRTRADLRNVHECRSSEYTSTIRERKSSRSTRDDDACAVARRAIPKHKSTQTLPARSRDEHFRLIASGSSPLALSAHLLSRFASFCKTRCGTRVAQYVAHENSRCSCPRCSPVSSASSSHSAAAQTPPAPSPSAQQPPTAFANLDLPTWLRIGVEHRGRLEGFTGGGFADESRGPLLAEPLPRDGAGSPMKPWLSAAVQAQDARVEGRNGAITGAPFRDQFDLRLAHADVGSFDKSRFALRGGRQELVFGDQRLVGHANWLNTARSFDGVRGVFRHKKLRVDGFAASVVTHARWTTSIEAAAATTSTARMRRWPSCRMAA